MTQLFMLTVCSVYSISTKLQIDAAGIHISIRLNVRTRCHIKHEKRHKSLSIDSIDSIIYTSEYELR